MQTKGLNNVSLYVEDLGRAAEFYQRVLGMEVHLRDADQWVWLTIPGHVPVFLIRKPSVTPPPWPALCLVVDSVDGVPGVRRTGDSTGNAIYDIADPSGNLIELVTV